MTHDEIIYLMRSKIPRNEITAVAKKMNVARNAIVRNLDGQNVRIDSFIRVANYIGVNIDHEEIVERCKQYKKRKGITHKELMEDTGLANISICTFLKGEPCTVYTFLDITEALGVEWGD